MAFDTHTHVFEEALDDKEKVREAIKEINNNSSLEGVINIGLDIPTSKECVFISNNNQKFYSAVGVHPLHIGSYNLDDLYDDLSSLAKNDKVVAIGEIGLDNTFLEDDSLKREIIFRRQEDFFVRQIEIANSLELPIIIHSNNRNKQVLDILRSTTPKCGCVFHCFQPDLDDLKEIIKNGYYISFAGRITYKTAKKSIEVAKAVPNDLFVVETDSPFVSPEPFRNEKGKSSYITYIIEKLAEVKCMSYEEIEKISSNNAKRLFKIRTSH